MLYGTCSCREVADGSTVWRTIGDADGKPMQRISGMVRLAVTGQFGDATTDAETRDAAHTTAAGHCGDAIADVCVAKKMEIVQ